MVDDDDDDDDMQWTLTVLHFTLLCMYVASQCVTS